MAKLKELHSPDGNSGASATLIETEVQTRIKEIIATAVGQGLTKDEVTNLVNIELKKIKGIKGLNAIAKQRIYSALSSFAKTQYYVVTHNMQIINQRYANSIGISLDEALGGQPTISEEKFRGFVTDAEKGITLSANYQKLVRQQLSLLASESPKVVSYNTVTGKKVSYILSARNLAEMTVRHDINMEELAEFKNSGVNFVWTSSHADCSKRCEKWQGKLFSLDGSTGVIDGIHYEPIENALNDNDGNSIINGYNCRHYLIEYQKGMHPPADFDKAKIQKERAIDQRQRSYENRIRQLKAEEIVQRAGGNKDVADKLNKRWKLLDKNYQSFSLQNNRAFYRWRTQVMTLEDGNIKINPNQETVKIAEIEKRIESTNSKGLEKMVIAYSKFLEAESKLTPEEKKARRKIRKQKIADYQKTAKGSGEDGLVYDQKVFKELSKIDKQLETKFNGVVNFTGKDTKGNTRQEHIANAEHSMSAEDVKGIEQALKNPDYYVAKDKNGNSQYYLLGNWGINKDRELLKVIVGYDKYGKQLITAFPRRIDDEKDILELIKSKLTKK